MEHTTGHADETMEHHHEELAHEEMQAERIWWAILPVLLSAVIGGIILFSAMTYRPAASKADAHGTDHAKDHASGHAAAAPADNHATDHAAPANATAKLGNFRLMNATNTVEISGRGLKDPVYNALVAEAKTVYGDKPLLASWIEESESSFPFADKIPALVPLFTQPETGIEFDGTKFHITWPDEASRDELAAKVKVILGEEYVYVWATPAIQNRPAPPVP